MSSSVTLEHVTLEVGKMSGREAIRVGPGATLTGRHVRVNIALSTPTGFDISHAKITLTDAAIFGSSEVAIDALATTQT